MKKCRDILIETRKKNTIKTIKETNAVMARGGQEKAEVLSFSALSFPLDCGWDKLFPGAPALILISSSNMFLDKKILPKFLLNAVLRLQVIHSSNSDLGIKLRLYFALNRHAICTDCLRSTKYAKPKK